MLAEAIFNPVAPSRALDGTFQLQWQQRQVADLPARRSPPAPAHLPPCRHPLVHRHLIPASLFLTFCLTSLPGPADADIFGALQLAIDGQISASKLAQELAA